MVAFKSPCIFRLKVFTLLMHEQKINVEFHDISPEGREVSTIARLPTGSKLTIFGLSFAIVVWKSCYYEMVE